MLKRFMEISIEGGLQGREILMRQLKEELIVSNRIEMEKQI